MSWYNENLQNGFIDTTQEFVGGGGGETGGGGGEVDLTGINTAIANLQQELLTTQTNFTNISGDLNDIKEVFKPKEVNLLNESLDTIIRNNTINSRIFLQNTNATPKVKIEAGKLHIYYDFDFTNAPTITAGWIQVDTYITAIKNNLLIFDTNLLALDTLILAPTVGIKPRLEILEPIVAVNTANIIELQAKIDAISAIQEIDWDAGAYATHIRNNFDSSVELFRESYGQNANTFLEVIKIADRTGGGAAAREASKLFRSNTELFYAFFQYVIFGLGGISLLVQGAGAIYDRTLAVDLDKEEGKYVLMYEKIKDSPSANEPKHLHKDGLLIIAATNNGFSTFNTYKITLSNLAVLRIKTNGPTGLAEIVSVEDVGGASFQVFNNIYIPKTSLGGTTGDLQIRVTSLISEVQVLATIINKIDDIRSGVNNRRRLREGIISKNEFGDGLIVVNNSSTLTNAETGEVLQVPSVQLNLNTNQFETINGVLNLKTDGEILTFNKLGYGFTTETIGDFLKVKLNLNTTHFEIIENVIYIKGYINSSSLVPINTSINTLTTNVSDLQTDVGTIETNILGINTTITDIQDDITTINTAITTANTNITTLQTDLNALETDVATIIGLNTDVVDLLDDVATLKTDVININGNITMINGNIDIIDLDIVDVNASLERVYKVLLPLGSTMTTDYKMNLGFKEIYEGYPYDLMMLAVRSGIYSIFNADDYNNDFLGLMPNMIRLAGTQNYNVYDTDQLAVNPAQYFTKGLIYFKKINENYITNLNNKFEFVSFLKFVSFNNNTTDYHIIQSTDALGVISNTKLSVFIRNRKLKVKHPALVSYGVYNSGTLNSITTRLLGAIEYFILEPITISGVPYNDNIRITSTPMGAGFDDYKYELKMLNVPYRLNNESEFINTPTGFIRIVNANDTTQPAFDTRFIAMYLNHPSVPSTPIANCIYPTISYSVGIKNNGDVFLDPDWNIQKIILRFDILFHRTQDQNFEGAPEYWPWPVLYQENAQITDFNTDFTFRLRYSINGINYITHNFTMNDVTGSAWQNGATSTGTTIRTGWYNNMDMPKRYWTYTYTIPDTYPIYGKKVRFVDFTLVKKPNWNYLFATTAENPYQRQPVLHLYEFKLEEYATTETQTQVISNRYETTETSSVLSTISNFPWHLFNLQLDLPNNSIGYYINNTYNNFTTRTPIILYPADITMPDPAVPFVNATFVSWANLTQNNGDLVIGNTPSVGSIQFTHFNWKFFQDLVVQFMTLTEIQKLTTLINYGYYEEYVAVDKLLTAGEIITYNIDTPNITLNKKQLIKPMTDTIRARDLRTEQTQDPANVLIRLDNLYVEDPVSSGNIYYDRITKTFTVGGGGGGGGGIGTRAEEDEIILGFIEDSAGYALQWDNVTKKLNVIPEEIWQDQTPIYDEIALSRGQTSNYVQTTSNYLKGVIDALPTATPYDDTAIYGVISTNDTNVSNYVWTTSNYLKSVIDGILPYDDTVIYGVISTNDTNVSNYVWTTSNYLKSQIDTIPPPTAPYDDTVVYGVISTNDTNVSNYVWTTSNYLKGVIDALPTATPYDDTAIYGVISTNDTNISNYVWTTSNYLKSQIDAIPPPTAPYDDTAVYTQITTTSNILFSDFVARDAVLKLDYIARDDIIIADSIERDDNLSASIGANKYTDAKVLTYLQNTATKNFGGFVGIGTTNPYALLEINGTYGTLLVRDNDVNTYNPRIDLIRGGGYFGDDGLTDWRVENLSGVFRISRQNNAFTPPFLECFAINGVGNVGIGTTSPSTLLQINGSTPTLTIVDTNGASRNPRIDLIAGSTNFSFGGDSVMDWRIHNILGNLHFFGQTNTVSYTPLAIASNGIVRFSTNTWHGDIDGRNRFRFNGLSGGITYMSGGLSGSANARTFEWIRLYDSATLGYIENTGLLRTWGYSSLSDERIKKDIEDINDDDALIKILALKPKKYNYIEKEKEGENKILGFIAQEVAEIIPEAVSKTKGVIPNIYKFCNVVDNRKVYFSLPQDLPVDTPISITRDELGEGKIYKILKIYNDYFVVDEDIEYSPAFVKGYQVDDLHNVKKDMIFSLNVSATQELHKVIIKQKNEINDLETRLARLEAIVSNMLSKTI